MKLTQEKYNDLIKRIKSAYSDQDASYIIDELIETGFTFNKNDFIHFVKYIRR